MNVLDLDLDSFKDAIGELSQSQKDELIIGVLHGLENPNKLKILLEHGACANQDINNEALWSIAFNKDVHINDKKKHYSQIMFEYLFDNHSENFKNECANILNESLSKYNALIRRSDVCSRTLGKEPKNIKEKFDTEFDLIIEKMLNDLTKAHHDSKIVVLKVVK